MTLRARFGELWNPEDVLDSLWRIVASPYVTMLLLIGLATLVCLGLFVPQRPPEAVLDPMANNLWLTSLRERYHNASDWLVRLGLFDIHRSLWFRGLLGLLALNLMLGTVDFISPRHLWRAGSPLGIRMPVGEPSLAESAEQSLERAKEILRGHRYRLLERADGKLIYADRFVLFPILVYLGLLLAITGLALSERTAWWEEGVTLRPGQVRLLGHGMALALRAESVEAIYDRTRGQMQSGHTELTFLRADHEAGRMILHNHAPSFYAGLIFYQTSTEPALLVRAQDAAGRDLALQTPETAATQFTEVALRFREEESPRYIVVLNLAPGSQLGRYFQQKGNEQYVLVPSRDLSLRLLYSPPASGEVTATFHVEAFRGAEMSPFYQHQFHSTETVEIASDRYTFKPQRYTVIKYGQDYGLPFIFAGAAMVLVGTFLSAWCPPRRLWLVAWFEDDKASFSLTTSVPTEERATPWFEDLVEDIARCLH